jgi:hydroxymethylpyrimidine pyrophosphatase-like HAD family hydrolase/energy-coupling factor transporter ATP-binding protein EcfA2
MRFVALAADYDGTLAHHGRVAPSTLAALERLKATGRRLIMVTGRELPDLESVFPHKPLFDLIVAENGALLHTPESGETRVLAAPPPAAFVAELRRRGVQPLSVGASIVATWTPHEQTVLEVIREIGLELQVIFNKGAVMVLPAGTNKATGLLCALEHLRLSPHNVVAIGDAENDHALLAAAECAAAVSNAVPVLREAADLRTRGDHGTGVEELIDAMISNDLADVTLRKPERHITIGTRDDGEAVQIPIAGPSMLVTGTSGSGKSTLVTGILEQLLHRRYQCCIIDPEGDYEELPDTIMFGTPDRAPSVTEVLTALEKPDASVVVNLLGVKLPDRPAFFTRLLGRLQASRTLAGRPHWMIVDEAHHLLPADWQPAPEIVSEVLSSMIYVTVHPETLSSAILKRIDAVAAIGDDPQAKIDLVRGRASPSRRVQLDKGEALVWTGGARSPCVVRVATSRIERRRHLRKYAEGDLGPDRSFFFRGPGERLNLRAQNLVLFTQIAEGVDEDTWLHHLREHDYSRWVRDKIKDPELAAEIDAVERAAGDIDADESLKRVREAIEQRYTLPATASPAAGSKEHTR